MKLAHTRAMIRAALEGQLEHVEYATHPIFNLNMPTQIPNVPDGVLDPRATWADPDAYDAQARKLAGMFAQNFQQFAAHVSDALENAGPRV